MNSGPAVDAAVLQLLGRVREVRAALGMPEAEDHARAQFGELLDSMGMVEFLLLVARDYGVPVSVIEEAAERRFATVADLAEGLQRAGLSPCKSQEPVAGDGAIDERPGTTVLHLAATATRLPKRVQPAGELNRALGKPAGWLESHAGIRQRHVWDAEDPLDAAAAVGRECLERARLLPEEIGVLLTTSEAPPVAFGLAAALHHRLELRPRVPALEIGGACVGFLAALRVGLAFGRELGAVLILAVEAPLRYLQLGASPAGEAAALFGEAAAAIVLTPEAHGDGAAVQEVTLIADGAAASLIQLEWKAGKPRLHLNGPRLAWRAVRAMGHSVRDSLAARGLSVTKLAGVAAHGGNGRMPGVLARELGLPLERVWSAVTETGNLGSASLPFAWQCRPPGTRGWIAWTAAGAGLTAGAALMRIPTTNGSRR